MKAKTFRLSILAVVSIMVITLFGQGYAETEGLNNHYVNAKMRFKINPPPGWTTNESAQAGTSIIFFNPSRDFDGQDWYDANLSVAVTPEPGLNLDQWFDGFVKWMTTSHPDYKVLSHEKIIVNGKNAVIFSAEFKQQNQSVKNLQMIILENKTVYSIAGVALQKTWEKYDKLIRDSLATFELI